MRILAILTWERLIALRLQKVIPLILMALCLSSHKPAAIRQHFATTSFQNDSCFILLTKEGRCLQVQRPSRILPLALRFYPIVMKAPSEADQQVPRSTRAPRLRALALPYPHPHREATQSEALSIHRKDS